MALPRQYVLSARVQALLSGVNSKALNNATLNMSFSTETTGSFPSNPTTAVSRALIFDKFVSTEYDIHYQNLDGTSTEQWTTPR